MYKCKEQILYVITCEWNLTNKTLLRGIRDQIKSVTQSCPTLCDPMNRSTPGLPVHRQLPEFTQTHIHLVSDAIQPSHPLSFPSPLAPNPSQHQSLFQWVALHIRWPKYWSFSFSPSSECSGMISFRMDWFDLLIVQGTLKNILQHNLKASILWCSAFFVVQSSHQYMTAGKNHSFGYMVFCQQSDVIHCLHLSQPSFQGASIF